MFTINRSSYDDKRGNVDEWLRSLGEVDIESVNNIKVKKILNALDSILDNELTPQQAKLIRGHYFQGESVEQLAQEYGVTLQAIYATLNRGKERLAKYLKYIYIGDEAVKGFCKCSAFKYRFRAGRKAGESAETDIQKAEWFESYLIEMEEGNK